MLTKSPPVLARFLVETSESAHTDVVPRLSRRLFLCLSIVQYGIVRCTLGLRVLALMAVPWRAVTRFLCGTEADSSCVCLQGLDNPTRLRQLSKRQPPILGEQASRS